MKTSKILFLIISLTFFSCEQDKNKKSPRGEYHYIMDSDGDLIPDHLDENIYIANDPLDELHFTLSFSSTKSNKEFSFDKSDKEKLYTLLSKKYKKQYIQFKEVLLPSVILPSKKFDKNELLELSYQGPNQVENISYELSTSNNLINSSSIQGKRSQTFTANLAQTSSNTIALSIKDFTFERDFRRYNYTDYLRSIESKTYELYIIGLNKTSKFNIATSLDLFTALKEIGFTSSEIDMTQSRTSPIFLNSLNTLTEEDKGWVIVNYQQNQKLVQKNKIYLVEINKKLIEKYYSNTVSENINLYGPSSTIDVFGTSKIKINIDGLIQYYHLNTETRFGTRTRGIMSTSRSRCQYSHNTITEMHKKISMFNINQYFDFYLDGQKFTPSIQQNFAEFSTQDKRNITISLKNNFQGVLKVGNLNQERKDDCSELGLRSLDNKEIEFKHTEHQKLINLEYNLQMEKELLPH